MKVGANRNQVLILSGLGLVAVYVLWSNVFSSSDSGSETSRARVAPAAPAAILRPTPADTQRVLSRRMGRHTSGEFKPVVEKQGNPLTVDPTLHLDLLAKVQNVGVDSNAQRNIFTWGDAPKPVDKTPLPTVPNIPMSRNGGPIPPAPPGPTTPSAPPGPPPITLKYYGYSTPKSTGHKRAFFLDGEDIIVAAEGELVKRRYKLVKIGVNSVTVEDTQFNNNQQTLPLAPDIAS